MCIPILGLAQLNTPEISCVSVLPNGDVQITWQAIANSTGDFASYQIYDSNNNLLRSEPSIITNTWIHTGANANAFQKEYYIKATGLNPANSSGNSSIYSSMLLTLGNPGNGKALLNWNKIIIPNTSTSTGIYKIWQEYPLGVWTQIGTTSYGNENFVDTISICNGQLNYKVSIEDISGCISESSINGDIFQDKIAPSTPIVNNVTVDPATGNTVINWNTNPDEDTQGYIILNYQSGAGWVILDTIYGINNTTYTHTGADASTQSEGYGIAAIDSCWHGSPASPNTSTMGAPDFSIHLTNQLNICESSVDLTWTKYRTWSQGVDFYEIYASENGGAFNLIGSNTSTDTTFSHSGINKGSTYCYRIYGYATNGILSQSNESCRFIYTPPVPAFGYTNTATVNLGGDVDLIYSADILASISQINLLRGESLTGLYQIVDTETALNTTINLNDNSALTGEKYYYYKVEVIDSCGNVSHTSNISRTIFLSTTANNDLTNTLTWTFYQGWQGNISQYNIYRSIDGGGFSLIGSTSNLSNFYIDDVSDYINQKGEFCYYIEAVEISNPSGNNFTANSNLGCCYQEELIFIPNAITINGLNPVFKPVASYVDINEFNMKIFNRWGQVVFETNDINTGWNGLNDKGNSKSDTFVYLISFQDAENNFIEKKGHITLVK